MRRFHRAPGDEWQHTRARRAFDISKEARAIVDRDGAPELSDILVHDR
jgi:hypothetical protein